MHELMGDENALTEQTTPEAMARREASSAMADSALPWATLSAARTEIVTQNGVETAVPHFTQAILGLDGTMQRLTGYMVPLGTAGAQSRFLLSPYPSSCPFCLPAGPAELVEIVPHAPIPFTYDSITVEGRFALLRKADDIAQGMYYRMQEAQLHIGP